MAKPFDPRTIDINYDDIPEEGLSVASYARHREQVGLRNHSYQTVYRAVKDGLITRNKHGKIDPKQADLEWFLNTDPSLDPTQGTNTSNGHSVLENIEEPVPFMVSKAQREAIRVQIDQRTLDELEGRLVNKDEIYTELFNFYRVIRDRLQNISVRLAPVLVGIEDPTVIEHKIEEEILSVLNELSQEGRKKAGIEGENQ